MVANRTKGIYSSVSIPCIYHLQGNLDALLKEQAIC